MIYHSKTITMKNYVDVKITVWQRYHFNDETDMQKIIAAIEKNGMDEIISDEYGFIESEILFDTEEELTPEENGRCSTIEVCVNNTSIWNNGNDDE